MSGACSPLSVGTDREGNMGDVLGKEPEGREDQLSDQFGENMEREEAEGAEAEEERSPDIIQVSPVLNLDPGDADQLPTVGSVIYPDHEDDENLINEAKEDHKAPCAVDAVSNGNCEELSQEKEAVNCSKTMIVDDDSTLVSSSTLEKNSVDKNRPTTQRSNSDDVGVYDAETSDIDIEGVVDADDEDDFEDDEDDDDDDDEEAGGDADDEDDFADNEVADHIPGIEDSCGADELQSKRIEEIKVNSDCLFSYSDSSDDSGLRTKKNKSSSGGRICDSMRRRKLTKVKECAPPRPIIAAQVDQTAMLSEAMTNLKLDGIRPELYVDGNKNTKIILGKRLADDGLYESRVVIADELLVPQDPEVVKTESESEVYEGQQIVGRTTKSDGALSTLSTEEENSSLNEEDIKELMRKEALQRRRESCTCEACQSKRLQMQEQRKLQGAWMELRHFVRGVYHIIMETPPDGVMPIVEPSQDDHMKAIAKRLTKSDPHQLYHRLQAQVHEFAAIVRAKLRDITEDTSGSALVATDFFEGLFHGYDKLTAAAKRVAPILEDLELRHLSRFNLTWELLNKAVYYQIVYNDESISSKLPEMVTLGQEYQDMIRFYMAFDDEMSIIQAMWRESFELLQKYNNQQAKIRAKQQMLLRDWEIFKAQRKRYQRSFDEGIELDRHSSVVENGSDIEEGQDMVVCPSCNRVQSCPCDECCLAHLFSCPAHQPAMRTDYSPDGPRVAGDGAGDGPTLEHTEAPSAEQKCECHICTAPPVALETETVSTYADECYCMNLDGESHHVHEPPPQQHPAPPYQFSNHVAGRDSTGVYPHLYNVHPSLLTTSGTKNSTDSVGQPCAQNNLSEGQPIQDLGKSDFLSGTPNHCQNLGILNTESDKAKSSMKILQAVKHGEKKRTIRESRPFSLECTTGINFNNVTATDLQRINGVTKTDVPAGTISVSDAKIPFVLARDPETQSVLPQAQLKPQPQPRPRFTAGPGVNVPDTDIYPDPPADFAVSPSDFAGEVATKGLLKLSEPDKESTCKMPTNASPMVTAKAPGTQEPVFVLTKAGSAPPTNIPSLQGKIVTPSEKIVLNSSQLSTAPATAGKTSPPNGSGPTIQGLLEEALERKKAEMARAAAAAAATAREPSRTVSALNAPVTATAATAAAPAAPATAAAPAASALPVAPVAPAAAAQPKPKQGHTCSSAKHKQHTHSPSHRDPKNCDCCFCEMFGHGAPPAAPTSHRFHENRQRLRSKLNKSRASKQQAAGVKPGAVRPVGATTAAAATPAAKPAVGGVTAAAAAGVAAVRPAVRPAAVGASAPRPAGAVVGSVTPAAPRPTAVGAPAAPPPGSLLVKTALPSGPHAVPVARTMTRVGPPLQGPAGSAPVSGATAARAIAYSVTAGCKSSPPTSYMFHPVPVKPVAKQEGAVKFGAELAKTSGTLVPKAVVETIRNGKLNFAPPLNQPPNAAFAAAAGSGRVGTAFTAAVGKSTAVCPQPTSNTMRPSHVSAAKMADSGLKKMKAQLAINSAKSSVTTSNQRVLTSAPAVVKGTTQQAPRPPQVAQTTQTPQQTPTSVPQKKVVPQVPASVPAPAPAPAPAPIPKEERVKKEDPRPIDELLDFIEGGSNSQPKTADSKKAAKKARQKLKKLEQQREESIEAQTPDVTITMLKDSAETAKGRKGSSKRTEEVVSTIPSATAQSIRDRIKSQVGEVAKKMGTSDQPQMVTIRRVMEPNSSEPTVTITLKGATPDKDKVLFTLVNGQNEVVCHDQASSQPKSKKQRKLERRLLRQQQQQQIQVAERVDDEEEEEDYVEEEEEIDLSTLTKTQRKKFRRLQRKREEERLAEEQRLREEEEERLRLEEERRRKEEEERLQQQKSKKNSKKDKAQKAQAQTQPQANSKKGQKSSQKSQPSSELSSKTASKSSKVNSTPDSDDEFVVPVQMTKKERKKARKLQQQLEEELRRQRQKEEEEREKQRQLELKEQKKKQKELQKVKQQQQKQQEKELQKQKEQTKKQQKQSQQKSQGQQHQQQQQQQQQQSKKQKQAASKQQQSKATKQGGRITTSIIPNPLTLGSYMPPVGSLEWTTQALAASRPNVTIQPASSASSSLGGLEQRFSTTLTLNGKPIMPPPRQSSPDPPQDFSLENLKLPPGITITKVDPSQVQQRKPPVSKPQVTKTVVPNPAPTTIIAAPLSGNRQQNSYNSGGSQDPNSNVIVVDTGKLKQDIAKREEEPEQVVTSRKKKNNKNKKGAAAPEPAPRPQAPSQLPPYLYGMNSVSITPAGQAAPHQPAPPPPQAAIIKMNGNMVTIRNPAIHPTPQRYVAPDTSEKESGNSRKVVANGGPSAPQNRNKENSNIPPRFANAKLSQQTNGVNGYIPEFSSAKHRPQHYDAAPQTYEVSKPHKHHYETPPRHFESRHFESPRHFDQAAHYDGGALHFEPSARHYDSTSHHFDSASRQYEPPTHHFDHSGRHFDSSTRSFEHAGRHFESASHHFEHSGLHCDQSAHHFNPPNQQMSALSMHEKHSKHMHPQNYAAAIEGKKNKLKKAYNNDDWQLLDSVFAPKDIDLDDGDIDDDERELEAFKRFCLQSVPPKRKEKVHLNIEDIVLKKKSSAVSCT